MKKGFSFGDKIWFVVSGRTDGGILTKKRYGKITGFYGVYKDVAEVKLANGRFIRKPISDLRHDRREAMSEAVK